MSKLVTALLVFFLASIHVAAQKRSINTAVTGKCTGDKKLIDPQKASVYLTFLKLETIEPADKDDDSEYLFFTITNN